MKVERWGETEGHESGETTIRVDFVKIFSFFFVLNIIFKNFRHIYNELYQTHLFTSCDFPHSTFSSENPNSKFISFFFLDNSLNLGCVVHSVWLLVLSDPLAHGKPAGGKILKKNAGPIHPIKFHLLIAHSCRTGTRDHLPLVHRNFGWIDLEQVCARNHSCYEFWSIMI